MSPLLTLVLPALLQAATPPSPPPPPPAEQPATLRLDEAVQVALERQPSMLVARATTRAASGRADQARSGLLPQITGTALYSRRSAAAPGTITTSAGGTPIAAPTGGGAYDFFSFGASASQLIWDFGQTYERTRAADRAADASRASERTAELAVVFNVRRAFFQARAQKALVRVAGETLANLQRHLEQVQGFVAVGTRPEIDLAQAKSDLASGRVALINAQNAYAIGKAQLAVAMGTPGTSFDVADEELAPIDVEEQSVEQLTKTAMTARPELAALARQRESQERTITGLKGGYGPSLSAVGGASESGTALGNMGPSWNVGATLTWPVFQGGLTVAQVREAEANLDVTRAQVEAEMLQIRLDVESAALTLHAAKSALAASNDALVNARQQLRLAEGRYSTGVGSIIELGDAQISASNAAAQVIQAAFNLSSARAQLLTAMGRR